MYQYLTQTLAVPATHIRLLLSEPPSSPKMHFERATRANILSSLHQHLYDNRDVRKGDNILFYFAGRGARYSLDNTFPGTEDTLDALCPADRGPSTAKDPILDISDRELSVFLEELRDVKGSNVTVILDCSYLLGNVQNRASSQQVRSAEPLPISVMKMLRAIREQPWTKTGIRKADTAEWDWDVRACMLLAACLLHEVVRETVDEGRWGSYFTRALIAVLRASPDLTYAGLGEAVTEYMPRRGTWCVQHPMVIGARELERVWFV